MEQKAGSSAETVGWSLPACRNKGTPKRGELLIARRKMNFVTDKLLLSFVKSEFHSNPK